MFDSHAARVLPGFDPEVKKKIFTSLKDTAEMIFNVNYNDIINNRQLSNKDINYDEYVYAMIVDIQEKIGFTPYVVINMSKRGDTHHNEEKIRIFKKLIEKLGCGVYQRYLIDGYPQALDVILSPEGYGKDDYVPVTKNLILVSGAASNSGKMSTCMGQIYQEFLKGMNSGYAKYETFPIRNLPLKHPINLAYEAATVDIGDYNCADTYYMKAYGKEAVNYNRDVDAFELLKQITDKFVAPDNFVRTYQSPTDMGINMAGFAITNDEIVSVASMREVLRRKEWYQEIINRGEGDGKWLEKCDVIYAEAVKYLEEKGYDGEMKLEL